MKLSAAEAATGARTSIAVIAHDDLPICTPRKTASEFESLADLRNDHLGRGALHAFDELVGALVDDREGRIVARNDGFELEEATAGERGDSAAHCEAVADRHDADSWLVKLVDQSHIGEDVGVAHVIERLVVREMHDDAGRVAKIGVRALVSA